MTYTLGLGLLPFKTEICIIVSSCDLDKITCFSLPSNALVVSDERYEDVNRPRVCVTHIIIRGSLI